MKAIAILVFGCVAVPVVLIPLLRAWHIRPEIFGVGQNTAIAQTAKAGQKLTDAERKSFLELLKKCPVDGGDPNSLDDTKLNSLTLKCKEYLKSAS